MKPFIPPLLLRNAFIHTAAIAWWQQSQWLRQHSSFLDSFDERVFWGAETTPLYGMYRIPPQPKGTLIATYGIIGNLRDQGNLQVLAHKALDAGYAVVLFDWRAHGETAKLSPKLTSDGLYEGLDFIHIAAQALELGCPAPFWLGGYSLGGQLALWGIRAAHDRALLRQLNLNEDTIAGGLVVCPNLDAERSLQYLVRSPLGRFVERSISRALQTLAQEIAESHPDALDPEAIERAKTIWGFDQELVIAPLGFNSVEAYYRASSPLPWLGELTKPTFILYAADDPLFDPGLIPLLRDACTDHRFIDLWLTPLGGHVGYWSSLDCQHQWNDPDPWWAWNRCIEWMNQNSPGGIRTCDQSINSRPLYR